MAEIMSTGPDGVSNATTNDSSTIEVPREITDSARDEAKKNISKEPTNIFPKNSLDKIGVSVATAKVLTKQILGIDKMSLPGAKNSIKAFQKKNGLEPIDGKVGKNTYDKMKEVADTSDLLLIAAKEESETEVGLSYSTLEGISKVLPKMMMKSENYHKILLYVYNFKNSSRFKNNMEPDYKDLLRTITGTTETDKKNLEESPEGKSFYSTIKGVTNGTISAEEGMKTIMKDPTLLMVGGLLFLFGVIGGDSKYTNSFMKRIGWIFGVGVFGKALWNKLGVGEIIKDGENTVKESAKDGILKTIADASKKTSEKIVKYFSDGDYKKIWSSITGFGDSISERSSVVFSNFGSYNDTLKKTDKSNYLKPEILGALQNNLLGDSKFLNSEKDKLKSISDMTTLATYINDDTKKALNDAGVTNANIKSFIHNHLLKGAGFEDDDNLVGDLFLTTEIKSKISKEIISIGDYTDNDDLNNTISPPLSVLMNKLNAPVDNKIGQDLALAIKLGKITDFKINDYPGVTTETKAIVKDIIAEVTKYNGEKKEIEKKIKEIDKIPSSIVDPQEATLKGYLTALATIKLGSGLSSEEFKTAKIKKEIDIYEMAKNVRPAITELGSENINDKLTEFEKVEKDIKSLEELSKISIGKVTDTSKPPTEFMAFWKANKEGFETAKKLRDENPSNTQIKDKADKILEKKTEFIKNYEESRKSINKNIVSLKTNIGTIDVSETASFDDSVKKLDKQAEEYGKIVLKIKERSSPDWNTPKKIWNQLSTGFVVFQTTINSIKELDKELGLDTVSGYTKIDFKTGLEEKRKKLEENYKLKIDTSSLNVSDKSGIIKLTREIQNEHVKVSGFVTTEKTKKIDEIKEIVEAIQTEFIEKIKASNSPESIFENYNILKSNTGTYTDGGSLVISWLNMFGSNDKVEDAYGEKVKNIKRKNILKSTIKQIPKLENIFSEKIPNWSNLKMQLESVSLKDILLSNNNKLKVILYKYLGSLDLFPVYESITSLTDDAKKEDRKKIKKIVEELLKKPKNIEELKEKKLGEIPELMNILSKTVDEWSILKNDFSQIKVGILLSGLQEKISNTTDSNETETLQIIYNTINNYLNS